MKIPFTRMQVTKSSDTKIASKPDPREHARSPEDGFASFGSLVGEFETYNPDILIGYKGPEIYRKMLRDPQVKAAFSLTVDTIISRKWFFRDIRPRPEQNTKALIDFFEYEIEKILRGAWLRVLKSIAMSKAYGFSVNEKIYEVKDYDGSPKWFLTAVKPRPFQTFSFQRDPFGNVSQIFQRVSGLRIALDPRKFIIHVSNAELDTIFGESDLRAVYRPYWEKDIILKLWAIYLERMAGGFAFINLENDLQPAEYSKLKDIMTNLNGQSGMILPKGAKFDIKMATATMAFETAIADRNLEIAKGLLMPTLLGFSGQQQRGSYAQAQIQLESFFLAIKRQGEEIADTLNEQLFRELAIWNFGEYDPPLFAFDPFTEGDKRAIVDSWTKALTAGAVIVTTQDEMRTRELLGYPSQTVEQEVVDRREEMQKTTEDTTTNDPGSSSDSNVDVPIVPDGK